MMGGLASTGLSAPSSSTLQHDFFNNIADLLVGCTFADTTEAFSEYYCWHILGNVLAHPGSQKTVVLLEGNFHLC